MVFLLLLVCSFGATTKVIAYSPYDSGTVSATYLTLFEQILNKNYHDDYIIFRSGQYSYSMLVGDIELNGSTFTSDSVKEYTYKSSTTQGYNQQYEFHTLDNQKLNMNVGNYIIYSNLGDYPTVIDKGDNLIYGTFLLFAICFVMYLFMLIFKHIF